MNQMTKLRDSRNNERQTIGKLRATKSTPERHQAMIGTPSEDFMQPALMGSLESQASYLHDPHLPRNQVQAILTHIGHTRGNRYVQRLVDSTQSNRTVVQRNGADTDWWDWLSTGVNAGSATTSAVQSAGTASLYGTILPGASRVADVAADVAPGLATYAGNAGQFASTGGRVLGAAGTGIGAAGTALGAYNLVTANTGSERLQAGADTAASAIGLTGGPLATAFSGGYAAGQLLDQAVGAATGESLSDRGGDGLFDLLGPGPGLWLADTFGL